MSLYKFFESGVEENPEILYQYNNSSYDAVYEQNKKKINKTQLEKFFVMLLNDKITEVSKTPIQNEILNLKVKSLASAAFAKYSSPKH